MRTTPDIHFMRITATTLGQICKLSETLHPEQRQMVADNRKENNHAYRTSPSQN